MTEGKIIKRQRVTEEKFQAVKSLSALNLSAESIGATLGMSFKTIHRIQNCDTLEQYEKEREIRNKAVKKAKTAETHAVAETPEQCSLFDQDTSLQLEIVTKKLEQIDEVLGNILNLMMKSKQEEEK